MKNHVSNTVFVLLVLFLAVSLHAQDKIATPEYWTAVGATAGMTYFDAAVTLKAVGTRNCTEEGWTPWLYGKHPTTGRTVAAMSGEVVAGAVLSYEIKKHVRGKLGRMWAAPLGYLAGVHARGAIHNLTVCG